ncbi:MAG TPA: sulfatase-like hydrolase/transferase [Vicinamibacteria bacterium]|nr:sulfatase-like hydrolase/transferase [Vicinamibacteria bacterium]
MLDRFPSVTIVLLLVAGCRQEPAPTAENLVIVTIDTLRADRLGAYGGNVETPNLDRIAREGALAEDARAQVPLTRPSHLSLFTGRYPFEHGVRENAAPPFESKMPLLAEILKERGFRTAGFVSSIVLSSETGIDRGFETFADDFGVEGQDAVFLDSVQKRGDATTEEAIAWLREDGGQPFFLWLHLYDPHDPYEPPEPHASRYEGRPYDGEVAFTDELVGRLDSELAALGHSESTLLVVTSDHGEAFGEHGETGHGYFIYEPTLRVPLLFRGPGVVSELTISTPVELVDVFPTVLEMLEISHLDVPGRSLAATLRRGSEPEPRPLYAESFMASLLYGWGRLVSVREGPWKLIEAPKPELYNLEEDPEERDNRIRRNAVAAERLRARIAELAPAGLEGPASTASQIDPELMEKLGALGYVGGTRSGEAHSSHIDPKDKLEEFRFLSGHMREGLTFLQEKDYESAIQRFRAVLESGNESFQALYHTGRAYYGLGRYREAVDAFAGAIALDDSYGPAYLDLAEAQVALGSHDDALEALHRGQNVIPESARLFEREGEIWVSLGRPDEAARAFEAVAERLPEDALTLVRLGEQYRDLGEIEKSISRLKEAVRLAPDDASYWNSLGMVLGGNGRMAEAEEAFRKAHTVDPEDAQYAFNLGLALVRLGRPEEARGFFEKALRNDPGFEPARAELRRLGGA